MCNTLFDLHQAVHDLFGHGDAALVAWHVVAALCGDF